MNNNRFWHNHLSIFARDVKNHFCFPGKVFPGSKYTGFKPKPTVYRKVVGWLEIVCGAILIIIPGPLKVRE